MREMKESGIDWIGKIPENWKIGKVKDIFVRKNEKANNENPTVLSLARSGVKIRDISTGEGQLAESYNNYNPVEIGDLLLNPMDLYSGANCSVSKVKGVISPAYINLRAKGKNNSTYYDYYFKTQYWGMTLFAHGKGVSFDNRWTLGLDTALNYFIPIPTEPEQGKIAEFLDKKITEIDNVIEKTKETIEDYKKYKTSIITKVVTKGVKKPNTQKRMKNCDEEISIDFDITKLKKICRINGRIGFRGYTQADLVSEGEGAITLSPSNFNEMKMNYEKCSYLTWEKYEESPEIQINNNDILFVKTGSSYGKSCLVRDLPMEATINPQMIVLKNISINVEYLQYYLQSNVLSIQVERSVVGGTIPTIAQEKIGNYLIIVPSIKEQNDIVNYLNEKCNEINQLINLKLKTIEELEEYKKSLIYEYVTGKKEVV